MHCVVMMNNINVQVLLVTGGYGGGYLDSTELLLPSATSWTTSAALPSPRNYLRGATLDNTNIDCPDHCSSFAMLPIQFL